MIHLAGGEPDARSVRSAGSWTLPAQPTTPLEGWVPKLGQDEGQAKAALSELLALWGTEGLLPGNPAGAVVGQ